MGVPRTQVLTAPVWDVAVVGAGPAGLMAARDLAAAGHATVVLEEHPAVGRPVHCTGVLGLDAFERLDLPRDTILSSSDSAKFVSAAGSSLLIQSERVRAAVVDRVRFDQALGRLALAAGARVLTGHRVRAVDVDRGGVSIRTDAAALRARSCVLACGASYRFNRALGLGLPRAYAQSAQLELPFAALEHIEVHFGRNIAPGGFAWVVPFLRDGSPFARVGLMCDAGAARHFKVFADQLCTRYGVSGWSQPRLKLLPLAPVRRTWSARVLAVGDAAGLVKPTTGGGIYYSLLSGRIAAEVLSPALEEDRLGAGRLREYERRWRTRLGPEIRAGLAFRAVAGRLTDPAIDALMNLARVDGLVPLLQQTADFSWHRAAAIALLRSASFRRVVVSSLIS